MLHSPRLICALALLAFLTSFCSGQGVDIDAPEDAAGFEFTGTETVLTVVVDADGSADGTVMNSGQSVDYFFRFVGIQDGSTTTLWPLTQIPNAAIDSNQDGVFGDGAIVPGGPADFTDDIDMGFAAFSSAKTAALGAASIDSSILDVAVEIVARDQSGNTNSTEIVEIGGALSSAGEAADLLSEEPEIVFAVLDMAQEQLLLQFSEPLRFTGGNSGSNGTTTAEANAITLTDFRLSADQSFASPFGMTGTLASAVDYVPGSDDTLVLDLAGDLGNLTTGQFIRLESAGTVESVVGSDFMGDTDGRRISFTSSNSLFVDTDALPGGDGLSWETAFQNLDDALDSWAGEEVWIAAGTYVPTRRSDPLIPQTAHFLLPPEITIRGGFAGTESNPEQRDFEANETVLSGDFFGDDPVAVQSPENNCYHILVAHGDLELDGLTITRSSECAIVFQSAPSETSALVRSCVFNELVNAPVSTEGSAIRSVFPMALIECQFEDSSGPVVSQSRSSITVESCSFTRIASNTSRGAVYVYADEPMNPSFVNCDFVTCALGGIYIEVRAFDVQPYVAECSFSDSFGSSIVVQNPLNRPGVTLVRDCIFDDTAEASSPFPAVICEIELDIANSLFLRRNAQEFQASVNAIYCARSVVMTECQFMNDESGALAQLGGVIVSESGHVTATHCFFSGGTGTGAINLINARSIQLASCTIASSFDSSEPELVASDELVMINSVLWAGGSGIAWAAPKAHVNFNCLDGITNFPEGGGNIASDPMFVDPDGPDDILGTLDDDLRLAAGSPCIDAGDNKSAISLGLTTDLDGNPRFVDDPLTADTGWGVAPIIDMGAFEYQPPEPSGLEGDANNDCVVDVNDISFVLFRLGTAGPLGDANADGLIDVNDISFVLFRLGNSC